VATELSDEQSTSQPSGSVPSWFIRCTFSHLAGGLICIRLMFVCEGSNSREVDGKKGKPREKVSYLISFLSISCFFTYCNIRLTVEALL